MCENQSSAKSLGMPSSFSTSPFPSRCELETAPVSTKDVSVSICSSLLFVLVCSLVSSDACWARSFHAAFPSTSRSFHRFATKRIRSLEGKSGYSDLAVGYISCMKSVYPVCFRFGRSGFILRFFSLGLRPRFLPLYLGKPFSSRGGSSVGSKSGRSHMAVKYRTMKEGYP